MTNSLPQISRRQAAFAAAAGLLLMAVLAPFANFYVLATLILPDDAAATFAGIAADPGLFRSAIAAFLVVALLDVVVAWALYFLFEPVDRSLALLAAWLRLVYAALLGAALFSLTAVLQLVSGGDYLAALPAAFLPAQVMLALGAFNAAWSLALGVFGFSLLLAGYLAFRSRFVHKWLGVLLVVAGAGYVVDSFGVLLWPAYSANLALYTFIGEPLFMFWLFWKAIRGFDPITFTTAIPLLPGSINHG